MYVIGGFHNGPTGLKYEYDPATDKWTKKTPMPVLAHHEALTEYRGKIYVFGGFVSNAKSGHVLFARMLYENETRESEAGFVLAYHDQIGLACKD